jgi:hypothetical protein
MDYMQMYEWIKGEVPDPKDNLTASHKNLENGLIFKFKISQADAFSVIHKFKLAFNADELIIPHDDSIHGELIDWELLEIKRLSEENDLKSGRFCRCCNRELTKLQSEANQKFCSDKCLAEHTNNIILFWQDDVDAKDVESANMFSIQQRIIWQKLIQHASIEEKLLRIKILEEIIANDYALIYASNERDLVNAKRATISATENSRRESIQRGNKLIQGAEATREIQQAKKSGEILNPAVKLGALSGKCLICETETVKEACSDKCRAILKVTRIQEKTYNFSFDKALKIAKRIVEAIPSETYSTSKTETVN